MPHIDVTVIFLKKIFNCLRQLVICDTVPLSITIKHTMSRVSFRNNSTAQPRVECVYQRLPSHY